VAAEGAALEVFDQADARIRGARPQGALVLDWRHPLTKIDDGGQHRRCGKGIRFRQLVSDRILRAEFLQFGRELGLRGGVIPEVRVIGQPAHGSEVLFHCILLWMR